MERSFTEKNEEMGEQVKIRLNIRYLVYFNTLRFTWNDVIRSNIWPVYGVYIIQDKISYYSKTPNVILNADRIDKRWNRIGLNYEG